MWYSMSFSPLYYSPALAKFEYEPTRHFDTVLPWHGGWIGCRRMAWSVGGSVVRYVDRVLSANVKQITCWCCCCVRSMVLRFPHHAGRCRPRITRFSFPERRNCTDMEGCLNRGWVQTLHGCNGTGRGQTMPRRYHPRVVLALPAPADKRSSRGIVACTPRWSVSNGRNRFSSPRCRSFGDIEGCLNRG